MYPVRRQVNKHAAELRRNRTDAEDRLWQVLRNRQLGGYKFRFQASIGPYIVDFLCIEARLVVEVDGSQHNETVDAGRTRFIEAEGYRILRFWNTEVLENPDGVAEVILAAAEAGTRRRPSPQPSPVKTGEG